MRSEAARLLAKGLEGCAYFVSQTVYHAPPTEALLRDYLRDCRGAGIEPRRVVLTFAPCGREKTLGFLRWLGVHIQGIDDDLAQDFTQETFVREYGVSLVGGCCGTTPEHLRRLVERVRGLTPADIGWEFLDALGATMGSGASHD